MRARRVWSITVGIIALALLLAGCIPQPPQVVKIGLVAPFEGRFREIGFNRVFKNTCTASEAVAALKSDLGLD